MLVLGCFACLGVAYGYLALLAGTTSSVDVDECLAIANAVEQETSIPPSISKPGSPAFFCDLGVRWPFVQRFDDIKIYGITDQGQQNALIESLRRYRERERTKPLMTRFFEKENWQTSINQSTGARIGKRGPEAAIRKVFVK